MVGEGLAPPEIKCKIKVVGEVDIQGYALMIYRLATDAYRLRYLASFVVSDRQIANIHAFSVMMVEDGAGDTRLKP